MDVQVERIEDVIVVKPIGVLDASNSKDFKQRVLPLTAETKKMLVDLSGLQVIDSSGLAVLLSMVRQLGGTGGDLKLCSPTRPVRTVLELVRMHRVVETVNDREEGLRAFVTGS